MHCEGSVTLFLGDDNSWPYARQNDLCVIDAIDALSLWLRTRSTRPSLAFPNEAWSSPSLSAQCFPRGEWRTSLQDLTRSYKMTGQDGQDPMLFGLEATSNLFLHVFHVKWLKYSKVGKDDERHGGTWADSGAAARSPKSHWYRAQAFFSRLRAEKLPRTSSGWNSVFMWSTPKWIYIYILYIYTIYNINIYIYYTIL